MADMSPERSPELSERDMADVCAFADGSLPAPRRAEFEARVAASPELRRAVERQRRSLLATQALASEPVPASLTAAVDARWTGRARRSRRRLAIALSAAGVLAAVVLAFVVLSLSGGPAAPTVADAARLAGQPSNGPPPATLSGTAKLAAAVQGLPFPDLSRPFGWRAVGIRQGRVGGREATVVYYGKDGRRVGYAIVAGPALPRPAGSASTTVSGVRFQTMSLQGRSVVTWRRHGHTCVMIGNVPPAELLTLASWHHGGSESY